MVNLVISNRWKRYCVPNETIQTVFTYYRNLHLDGMNDVHDDDRAFSVTSRIGKVYIETQNASSDLDMSHLILPISMASIDA